MKSHMFYKKNVLRNFILDFNTSIPQLYISKCHRHYLLIIMRLKNIDQHLGRHYFVGIFVHEDQNLIYGRRG